MFLINFKYLYVFSVSISIVIVNLILIVIIFECIYDDCVFDFWCMIRIFVFKWLNGWFVWDIFFLFSCMYMKCDIDLFIRLYVFVVFIFLLNSVLIVVVDYMWLIFRKIYIKLRLYISLVF